MKNKNKITIIVISLLSLIIYLYFNVFSKTYKINSSIKVLNENSKKIDASVVMLSDSLIMINFNNLRANKESLLFILPKKKTITLPNINPKKVRILFNAFIQINKLKLTCKGKPLNDYRYKGISYCIEKSTFNKNEIRFSSFKLPYFDTTSLGKEIIIKLE